MYVFVFLLLRGVDTTKYLLNCSHRNTNIFYFCYVELHLTRHKMASFPYVILHCWSAVYSLPGNAAFKPELTGTFFKQSLGNWKVINDCLVQACETYIPISHRGIFANFKMYKELWLTQKSTRKEVKTNWISFTWLECWCTKRWHAVST